MNINPFELMKNAKDLQTHFGKMQEELACLSWLIFCQEGHRQK